MPVEEGSVMFRAAAAEWTISQDGSLDGFITAREAVLLAHSYCSVL